MILYHHPTKLSLVCPKGCHAETIEGLTSEPCSVVHSLLLIRHPVPRLKTIYHSSRIPTSFKNWIRSVYIAPCARSLANPDETIRYEWFTQDLLSIGIAATIAERPAPSIDICLQTRAYIRKQFQDDYTLGDYD